MSVGFISGQGQLCILYDAMMILAYALIILKHMVLSLSAFAARNTLLPLMGRRSRVGLYTLTGVVVLVVKMFCVGFVIVSFSGFCVCFSNATIKSETVKQTKSTIFFEIQHRLTVVTSEQDKQKKYFNLQTFQWSRISLISHIASVSLCPMTDENHCMLLQLLLLSTSNYVFCHHFHAIIH